MSLNLRTPATTLYIPLYIGLAGNGALRKREALLLPLLSLGGQRITLAAPAERQNFKSSDSLTASVNLQVS